ncbi:hypothetical protein RvY_13390 [Ramazzottius varieornatus]|uniref:Uncharacterized protein n=1 Tax=Ramazzottius varieornatus TaxID=947166 RepID=A0A1D1VRR3_RAMVA|nr:hypothetical protein RvY_13390 [Ramazzottius varieornatus]
MRHRIQCNPIRWQSRCWIPIHCPTPSICYRNAYLIRYRTSTRSAARSGSRATARSQFTGSGSSGLATATRVLSVRNAGNSQDDEGAQANDCKKLHCS